MAFSLNGPVIKPTVSNPVPGYSNYFKPAPIVQALDSMKGLISTPKTNIGGTTTPTTIKPVNSTIPSSTTQPTFSNPVPGYSNYFNKTSGLLSDTTPKPITPVKSQQQNNADGSSTITTYHNPSIEQQKADIQSQISNLQSQIPEAQKQEEQAKQAALTTYPNLVGQAQQVAQGNIGIGQKATELASKAGQEYADIGKRAAGAEAGYSTTGTTPVAEGNAAVIARTAAAQQQAVAQGLQAQLQGTGQQLTAQQQAQAGLTGLAGLTPELLRYGTNAAGQPMTAAEATQFKSQLGSVGDFTTQYLKGQANLKAADAIQNQIVSTLQANPTLNNTPISAFTNLYELFSGQVSEPSQQLLSQQVNSYITQLGIDPATAVNIAHQQKGTLADLLDSLRATAEAQTQAYNPSNLVSQTNKPTTGAGSSVSNVQFSSNGTPKAMSF